MSVGLPFVHTWIVKCVLPPQGKGRPQHAQGASTSSLNLLGQSYALVLPSADAIGVQSWPVVQPPHLSPRCLCRHQVVTPLCWCEPQATARASGLSGTAPWGQSRRCPRVSQHRGGKDQENSSLPGWSRALVACPAFLPPLLGRQKAQGPVQAGAGRLPAAASH